ncbi:hypothetical protein [Variovorax gossypii]
MKHVRLPPSLRIIPSISLALVGFSAQAESIYLSCTTTSFSGVDFAKVYKQVPKNPQGQFLQDALMEYDLVNLLKDRADSWEVNLDEKTVSSPEGNSGPEFTDAKISSNKIEARVIAFGKSYVLDVNRISGKMIYTAYLPKDVMASWKSKHGGDLPFVWQWEKACTATKPKI